MLRKPWPIGIAAVCVTLLWFALLTGRPLFDPDEGRYAEIPREMLSGGDWVIPHLNGLVYLEKPPLQYWLTALTFHGLGMSEFAARLCTGLAGYLSLLLVYLTGARIWGGAAGAMALSYTAASSLFVLLGHQLTLDMLLSLWLLAALAAFLSAQFARGAPGHGRGWMLGCWAAMALAVLTKGLIGVLIPAASLTLYVVWQRDWRALRHLNFRWGLPLFAAIALPWFILAARANPAFLKFFFVREHFQRFLTPVEHRTEPWWFFVPVLIVGILPWFPQTVSALFATLRAGEPRGQFDASRLLWVWCVFVFVFFSLSDAKLIPYILPAIPALALLCAKPGVGNHRGSLIAGAILSLAWVAGVLGYASGRWASPDSQLLLRLIRPTLFYMCVVLALGAVVCILCAARARFREAWVSLCLAWCCTSVAILVAADTAQELFSAKDLALAVRKIAGDAPVFSVQCFERSLPFYLQRSVVLVSYRDEFDLGLAQNPDRGIPSLEQFSTQWLKLPQGYAIMSPETQDRLVALRVPMREIARFPGRVIISRR